jgi:hypothetical protein
MKSKEVIRDLWKIFLRHSLSFRSRLLLILLMTCYSFFRNSKLKFPLLIGLYLMRGRIRTLSQEMLASGSQAANQLFWAVSIIPQKLTQHKKPLLLPPH